MTGTTLCPHCQTRFRVTGEQLETHEGRVRCGHCQQAFDARADFVPDEPDPQLDLPIPEDASEPAPQPAPSALPEAVAAPTLAEQITLIADTPQAAAPPKQWPWAFANIVLLLALSLQGAYFFRVELAARLPGLKPALVSACTAIGCTIPLPNDSDLIGIESSSLEAHPEAPQQITLHALLRNHAAFPQAYPALELSLNEVDDRPLARRILYPQDYLPPNYRGESGLGARQELEITLNLEVADLHPEGYRLFVFYPQNSQ